MESDLFLSLESATYDVITDDILNVIEDFEDRHFKLIMTSPPYNIGKSYEKKQSLEEYLHWQEQIIAKIPRILSDNGNIIWQVGNYVQNGEVFPLDIFFYPIFKKYGFKLRNRVIWHFEHGLHCSKRFSGRYETLMWFTKTDDYVFNLDSVRIPSKYPGKLYYKGPNKGKPSGNPLGKNPSDFWTLLHSEYESGIIDVPNVKNNHPEKTVHPCQFPVELAERCILAFTNKGDWILDPFGGVGTTLVAAIKNYRRAISVEIDARYSSIALDRVKKLQEGTLKLRPLGKKIYEPSKKEKISQIPLEWRGVDENF